MNDKILPYGASFRKAIVGLASLVGWWALLAWSVLVAPASAQVTVYTYDTGFYYGVGRLSSVADSTGTTTLEYDMRGNVTKETKTINNDTYTVRRTYNSLNQVVDITYPDAPTNEVVRHSYNRLGLLVTVRSITYDLNYVILGYNASSQIVSKAFGNGKMTTYDYFDTSAEGPVSYRLRSIATPGLQDLTYTYDAVGNVRSMTDTVGIASQSFGYDHLNRLVSASSNAVPTFSHVYSYDTAGNMQSVTGTGVGAGMTFGYPAPGSVRYHAPTSGGGSSYLYDDNGNLRTKTTGGVQRTFSWNADDQLTSVSEGATTLATFGYDYSGKRVRKTANGITTIYVGDEYECASAASTACRKYILANGERIAMRPVAGSAGEVYYYHTDHLGSTAVLTNRCGNKEQEIAYYPYGALRISNAFVDNTCSGSALDERIPQLFTGQNRDPETDLYDYGARYYDPGFMHFLSPDPFGAEQSNPQTLNRYSYVLNNPLKYTDPTGHYAVASPPTVQIQYIGGSLGSFGNLGSFGGTSGFTPSFDLGGGGSGGTRSNDLLAANGVFMCTSCPTSSDPLSGMDLGPTPLAVGGVAVKGGLTAVRILNQIILRYLPSSRALGAALEAAGVARPLGSEPHHIVAGSARAAAEARAVLQRFGIGINEAANGVFLPADKAAAYVFGGGAAAHRPLHSGAYYEAVNALLRQATTRAEVLQALEAVRKDLLSGGFP